MDVAIRTARLNLRPWQEKDLEPFAKLNADPQVREFFPSVLTREESDLSVKMMSDLIEKYGWGFWAVSLVQTDEFIGMIGLNNVNFEAHFTKTPAVEIGWRLAREHWGKGYATEGALACLNYGFDKLELPEIVAFTAVNNVRSRQVMEKIGMHHDPKDDFDHPKVTADCPLKRQALYRIRADEWKGARV